MSALHWIGDHVLAPAESIGYKVGEIIDGWTSTTYLVPLLISPKIYCEEMLPLVAAFYSFGPVLLPARK